MNGTSDDPQRQLPPPVLAKSKKKSAKAKRLPWYRHTAWIIPLAACVVFAVLIAGGLAVRQVVVLVRGESRPSDEPGSPPVAEATATPSDADPRPAEAEVSAKDSFPGYEPDPDEPVLEVLPPLAAKEKGRKLAKMLLVGQGPDMFPDVNAALEAAIPGDTIEIRTNGPISVRPHLLKQLDPPLGGWLTIRGGNGWAPVLRLPREVFLQSYEAIPVRIERLHFVSRGAAASGKFEQPIVLGAHGSVRVRHCTLTAVGAIRQTLTSFVVFGNYNSGKPAEVVIEHCFLRRATPLVISHGDGRITMKNCVVVGPNETLRLGGGRVTSAPVPPRQVEVANCTVAFGRSFAAVNLRDRGELDRDLIRAPVALRCEYTIVGTTNLMRLNTTNMGPEWWQANSIYDRIAWQGERNVYEQPVLVTRLFDVDGNGAVLGETPAENLAQWRAFWKRSTDQTSRQAAVRFRGQARYTDEELAQFGLPAHFALVAINNVPVQAYDGLGCDVTKLPIPPAVTTAPY